MGLGQRWGDSPSCRYHLRMSLGQREKHTHPRGLTNTVNHGGDVDIVGAVLEPGREVRRWGTLCRSTYSCVRRHTAAVSCRWEFCARAHPSGRHGHPARSAAWVRPRQNEQLRLAESMKARLNQVLNSSRRGTRCISRPRAHTQVYVGDS